MSDEKEHIKYLYSRDFLNRKGFHSIGAVEMSVTYQGWNYVEAEVGLSDCRKTITLDFTAGNKADARNALYKARLLADRFQALAEALEEAFKHVKDTR